MLSWLLHTFREYFGGEKKWNLSRLPPHILDDVVDKMDVKSRLILRKTDRTLRFLAFNRHLSINEIAIRYSLNYIEITMDGDFRVRYQDIGGGVVVRCDAKMSLVQGEGFVENFKRDLFHILNHKNLKIGTLRIEHFRYRRITELSLLELVAKTDAIMMDVFQDLKNQLNVEHLVLKVYDAKELRKVFLKLNPDCIQSLKMPRVINSIFLENVRNYRPLNDAEVFESAQWKRLNHIFSEQSFTAENLLHVTHCNFASVRLYGVITAAQFQRIRVELLKNPQLDQMKIRTARALVEDTGMRRVNNFFRNPVNNQGFEALRTQLAWHSIHFRGPKFETDAPIDEEEPIEPGVDDDDFGDEEPINGIM